MKCKLMILKHSRNNQVYRQLKVDMYELMDELSKIYDKETVAQIIRILFTIEET